MDLVSHTIENRKSTICINRPEALNALNSQVLERLKIIVTEIQQNENVHVVVLTSAGDKAFVAGADIKEMYQYTPSEGQKFSKFGQQVFSLIENLPQIVIAKCQGFTLGGGLELALSCDFIVASQNAKFAFPETSIGLIPGFAGHYRLLQRIGYAKAIELIATGQKIPADEAKNLGLVNHVTVPNELEEKVNQICNQILANGTQAIKKAKLALKNSQSSLNQSVAQEFENSLFGLCFDCKETKEGLSAFLEKRPANFRQANGRQDKL